MNCTAAKYSLSDVLTFLRKFLFQDRQQQIQRQLFTYLLIVIRHSHRKCCNHHQFSNYGTSCCLQAVPSLYVEFSQNCGVSSFNQIISAAINIFKDNCSHTFSSSFVIVIVNVVTTINLATMVRHVVCRLCLLYMQNFPRIVEFQASIK